MPFLWVESEALARIFNFIHRVGCILFGHLAEFYLGGKTSKDYKQPRFSQRLSRRALQGFTSSALHTIP